MVRSRMPDHDDLVARTLLRVLGATKPRRAAGRRGFVEPQFSGAHPDERDPQLLSNSISRLVDDRGWSEPARAAQLMANWPDIVGADIASHASPVSLRDGELVVQAESASWATQLTLLKAQILDRITRDLGVGLVTSLRVHGPVSRSPGAGRWRVSTGRRTPRSNS